jgi:hypothetical protein
MTQWVDKLLFPTLTLALKFYLINIFFLKYKAELMNLKNHFYLMKVNNYKKIKKKKINFHIL